ncbi:MAG TPA: hypothetical protein VFC19_43545 [Candidatus Limnocylindrales bacterium]|nr:hypothetical protein [Candidatus Limnocylindrales bacterium]
MGSWEVSRVRIFKASHGLFVLLLVTFGLFLANTLWHRGPASDPSSDLTVTVFTDLPNQPDAPGTGVGGVILVLAILCVLFVFVSAVLAVKVASGHCRSVHDRAALLN